MQLSPLKASSAQGDGKNANNMQLEDQRGPLEKRGPTRTNTDRLAIETMDNNAETAEKEGRHGDPLGVQLKPGILLNINQGYALV
jgi:hypothetical protein